MSAILPTALHNLVKPYLQNGTPRDPSGEQSRQAGQLAASAVAEAEKRRKAIVALARAEFHCEGDLEIDDNARVSESEDNGVFVAAWIWLPFDGTAFDKGDRTR